MVSKSPDHLHPDLDAERKQLPFMIRRRTWSFCHVVIFNWCQRTAWLTLVVSPTLRRTFEMSHCETPAILDTFLCESPWPEYWIMVSIITERVLLSMISTLVEDGNWHTATVHCWMGSTWMQRISCGTIGESALPVKMADKDWLKVTVDHQTFSEGPERFVIYCKWAFVELWGKMVAPVEWFHTIGTSVLWL